MSGMRWLTVAPGLSVAALTLLTAAGTAMAQTSAPAAAAPDATTAAPSAPSAPPTRSSGIPQRDTLQRMMRPVTIQFKEHRLEDVMKFLTDITQADIEVMWQDDFGSSGLEKDTPITLKQDKGTALDLLLKVLDKAQSDTAASGNSWQLNDSGTLQVGPKARLNKFKYVKLYSIADLLLEIPDYANAPEFDLQSVLQNQGGRGGGGGSQSPFRDNNTTSTAPTKTPAERGREIQEILISLVEPDQWLDNGGDGATVRYFQGNLLVNAPDYIHRQIDGYPYWPAESTRVSTVKGRRYVTLGVDTSTNKLDGFVNQPVTAVVPGAAGPGAGNPGGTPGAPSGPPPRPNGTPPRGPR